MTTSKREYVLYDARAAKPTPTAWGPIRTLDGNTGFGKCLGLDVVGEVKCNSSGCPYFAHGLYHCGGNSDADPTVYEYRWPSGTVGVGKPEFRAKPVTDDQLCDASLRIGVPRLDMSRISHHSVVVIDGVVAGDSRIAAHPWNVGEGGHGNCPKCSAMLPSSLVTQIAAGDVDCPKCGWREGRCRYCNGWVIAQCRGKPRCNRCHNTQEG